MKDRPRLLYLITEDWYFWSHRLDLARIAAQQGFDVSLATRVTDHGERIVREGIRLFPIRLFRRSWNPLAELASIYELVRLYQRYRPMIVHHVALKPILYGSFAAWWVGVPVVVNAFAGLGYTFTDETRHGGFFGACLRRALATALSWSNSLVIFQNQDDCDLMVHENVVARERTRIIPGSGIDTKRFDVHPPASGAPIVMLASRMLWDKGIGEFVEAARRLKEKGLKARFVLVGRCDEHNPAAIDENQLRRWVDEQVIEWWGHQEDMVHALSAAALVVLPSYREGLPKVLLEGAACGRPLVATDVPGCREIVTHGVNGFLVPPRDPVALAAAIDALIQDSSLRVTMGNAARETVIRSFSTERVAGQVIALYHELLVGRQDAKRTV